MEVNYLAVLGVAIVNMTVGAIWYSPILFLEPWMKLSGLKNKDVSNTKKKGMAKELSLSFVSGLVLSFALAVLMSYVGVNSASDGALVGLLVGLGFVATTMLPNYVYENKSLVLWKINAGYPVVALTLMGAILALF